jgi:hypothetical protein
MKTKNSDKAVEILYNKYQFDSSEMGWAVGHLKEWYDKLPQAAVSGTLPLAAKELVDEAWRMLPDSCKEIMKNLEVQYKESLAADIEHKFSGNDR